MIKNLQAQSEVNFYHRIEHPAAGGYIKNYIPLKTYNQIINYEIKT